MLCVRSLDPEKVKLYYLLKHFQAKVWNWGLTIAIYKRVLRANILSRTQDMGAKWRHSSDVQFNDVIFTHKSHRINNTRNRMKNQYIETVSCIRYNIRRAVYLPTTHAENSRILWKIFLSIIFCIQFVLLLLWVA